MARSNQPGSSRSYRANSGISNHAMRVLMNEYQNLQKEPMEGFKVKLGKDDNICEWEVTIFGPPDTIYAGGYFRALMKFPPEYPFQPPTVRFFNCLWHPNIYKNGTVCISILHPPTDDPHSGELPCERWNPTQNAHSVLMSVISLLNEPNINSAANVEASVTYRRWKENGDPEYVHRVKENVESSRIEAVRDGVRIPTTIEDYCMKKSDSITEAISNKGSAGDSEISYSDLGDIDENSIYTFSDDEEPTGL
ncbi:ubiquitin-conjugating enzyme E2 R1-like [Paramacrobiotus metropolitanus]|uniref:ubiquitin-conjugating enzyme E2 R1-like n=1 Tax=Paramacrobiotus metropolitanus TaxID=2943436 RepID=UPI0024464830|nr:ubiquitin-conjugating enzyme E2 R1-like [Paramacrobiotus metropolitanus]